MYDMRPYLQEIDRVIQHGPYRDTWESLSEYRPPLWYEQAKFGIFIHWGVYSVPAFGSEWYSRGMYERGTREFEHHVHTYGPQKEFGYKDFIPLFKAEKFDAEAWAELFAASGARYVVPVAEHHDGFQMYRSEISHWNAYEMGPRRDVLGELKLSCERRGLRVGASSHRAEHWFFMGHGMEFESDIHAPMSRGDFYWPAMPEPQHYDLFSQPAPTEEYLQDWLVRTCELIDRYQPKIIYFDWWIQHSAFKPYLRKLAAYYYNRAAQWGTQAVINYKNDAFAFGSAVLDMERGQFAGAQPWLWQTDTSTALNSWGYTEDNQFRPYQDILCDLVDIVSKNGRLLLNVGPKADGTFAPQDRDILASIGRWLAVNGEAIHGARPWRVYGEGPTQVTEGQFSDGAKKEFTSEDIRFTTRDGFLYAIVLKRSANGRYRIRALGDHDAARALHFHGILREVTALGVGQAAWRQTEEALEVQVDAPGDAPLVLRIELE